MRFCFAAVAMPGKAATAGPQAMADRNRRRCMKGLPKLRSSEDGRWRITPSPGSQFRDRALISDNGGFEDVEAFLEDGLGGSERGQEADRIAIDAAAQHQEAALEAF